MCVELESLPLVLRLKNSGLRGPQQQIGFPHESRHKIKIWNIYALWYESVRNKTQWCWSWETQRQSSGQREDMDVQTRTRFGESGFADVHWLRFSWEEIKLQHKICTAGWGFFEHSSNLPIMQVQRMNGFSSFQRNPWIFFFWYLPQSEFTSDQQICYSLSPHEMSEQSVPNWTVSSS